MIKSRAEALGVGYVYKGHDRTSITFPRLGLTESEVGSPTRSMRLKVAITSCQDHDSSEQARASACTASSFLALDGIRRSLSFFDRPLDGVNWTTDSDLCSPWTAKATAASHGTTSRRRVANMLFKVTCRDFLLDSHSYSNTGVEVSWNGGSATRGHVHCIFIATGRSGSRSPLQRHWVLLMQQIW